MNNKIMSTILNHPNKTELIKEILVQAYADYDCAVELIKYNNKLVEKVIQLSEEISLDYRAGMQALMVQMNIPNKDKHSLFATMTHVCAIYFPKGLCKESSSDEQKYFKKYVKLCNDIDAYDENNPEDVQWAEKYGYVEYINQCKQMK